MNALLFINCFNYTLALYCSIRCVIVPLNQYDDDDDDDDDAYIYTRNTGCITTTPANLALAVSTQPFGARNDYDRAVTSQRRDCEMTRWTVSVRRYMQMECIRRQTTPARSRDYIDLRPI